jgi:uncharacterized alpha-E superfamily protein
MLARVAGDLYWLGRYLSRAERTARMLDGLFSADLQGRPEDPGSVTLSWESLLVIMAPEGPENPPSDLGRQDVVRLLTLDPGYPVSVLSCVQAARETARVSRDTISAEMWESVNTFHLGLKRRDLSAALRTGPYSVYAYVKERCALFFGLASRTMLDDEARAFLFAGARIESAQMALRMLRVALPPGVREGDEGHERPLRDGNALPLLHAMGGLQAYMRGVPEPPNAPPVARFLLYERDFPDSVAGCIDALRRLLRRADPAWRESPAVLRLARLGADLDLRAGARAGSPLAAFRTTQHELERVDAEIGERYFGGRIAPARVELVA